MPLLIIAGVPSSYLKRNRAYDPQFDRWNVKFIGSKSQRSPDLRSCWNAVISVAAEDKDGAHIFAYHNRESDYPSFNADMRDRFRLVWMRRETLNHFGSAQYSENLQALVDFEVQWRKMLRPRSVSEPSLLPETAFSPIRCKDMWERIRSINLKRDNLDRVVKLISHFRETHYRRGFWQDEKGLQFKRAPESHGPFPPYGRIKFSFKVPEGFHYNVQNARHNRGFTVIDAEGQVQPFNKYTNIDCHGSIRGGE